ncbi:ketopantoate reductase family protein [Amphibacillus jilinensis]|uniref:ketopantoate reductase family protein n=1 Tax=Amphibacillus jilinensis TaxID=1216008 RepID=UPI0002F8354D|nr:2-dehydropantoate 2-reductase [Amphibacillus jilinensis]
MDIAIIGGGAIGLLMTALLADTNQVSLYVRNKKQYDQILKEDGIYYKPGQRKCKVKIRLIKDLQVHDLFILAVKSYQLEPILKRVNVFSSPLLFIQNGMAHIELIDNYQFIQPIFIATCEHGAYRESLITVAHTGVGKINIAPYVNTNVNQIKKLQELEANRFPLEWMQDAERLLKEKLILNAVINPITAIYNVKNGSLIKNKFLYEKAKQLTYEVAVTLKFDPKIQWERMLKIICLTQENHSSMKVDMDKGQLTEVDSILGYLVRQAEQPVPLVTKLYTDIKKLEKGGV